ncbi:MAG: DUF6653 family protein [Hyphomicrobium aestuarii]|nr:DUF6653 family protein [Hyphomicrobium aestuarii]
MPARFSYGAIIARLFRMDDEAWERHASPWSVWTRVPTIVPLLAAVWVNSYSGWLCALSLGVVAIWSYLNLRVFPPPASTDNWASKATFGERIWLNRGLVPIPTRHVRVADLLAGVAGLAFAVGVVGAWFNEPVSTLTGGAIALFAKLWFCDRMVWIYEDMKDADPRYQAWRKPSP